MENGLSGSGKPTIANAIEELLFIGSSLKICLVAEGEADIYPRLGPAMEWDTGAAHASGLGLKFIYIGFRTFFMVGRLCAFCLYLEFSGL